MRKTTKLFAALALAACMGGQATAQIYKPVKRAETLEAGKEYFLYNTTRTTSGQNRSGFYYDNSGAFAVDQSTDPSALRLLSADKAKYTYTLEAVGEEGQWAIKSASGYVGIGGVTNNAEAGTNQTFTIEKYADSEKKSGSDVVSYPDLLAGEAAGDYTAMSNTWAIWAPGVTDNNCFNGNQGSFARWSTAHPYAFYEIAEVAATVVYQYKDNVGNTIAASETTDLESTDGFTVPEGKAIDGFTYIGADKDAVEAGAITTVTYTYKLDKLPFVTSDVAGSEWTGEEHWYTLNQRDTYWVYDAEAGQVDLNATLLEAPLADAALWCIAGNTTDGFKFYNKAVGPEQSLYVGDGDNSYALLQADGAAFNLYYQMADGQPTNLCFFKVGDTENVFLNKRENKLSTWVSAGAKGEIGSIVNFVEPSVAEFAYLETVRTNIESTLGYVGNYSQADYDASGMADATTPETFAEALAALKACKTIAIEEGKYYRLLNAGKNQYLANVDNGQYCPLTANETAEEARLDVSTLVTFEGDADNGYRIKSEGLYISQSGKVTFNGRTAIGLTATETDADAYLLAPQDEYNTALMALQSTYNPVETGYLHSSGVKGDLNSGQGGGLVQWNATSPNSRWYIVPATDFDVTLETADDGKSYATVYLPFAATTDGSVQAYYATKNDGAAVTMSETADGIAANEGALLISEEGAASTTLAIATEPVDAPEVNLLAGGNVVQNGISGNDYYIFQQGDDGIGFYRTDITSLPANRAYINNTDVDAATSLTLAFGQPVGIESVATPAADAAAPLYDLQGRRVEKAVKGIYIQGGKKVYVK